MVAEEVVELGIGEAEMGGQEVGGVEQEVAGMAPDVAPSLGEDAGADGLSDGKEGEDRAEDGVREAAEAVRPAWVGRLPPARRHGDPMKTKKQVNSGTGPSEREERNLGRIGYKQWNSKHSFLPVMHDKVLLHWDGNEKTGGRVSEGKLRWRRITLCWQPAGCF